ncbi:MAG: SDR family NAD(P)-dependent oxidoreductase [Kovacikia sp.]
MTQLDQAVILITGASGGFGQVLTHQLLSVHSQLILTDLDAAVLQSAVARTQQDVSTGKVLACLAADLSSREGCEALYRDVIALGFVIDILINNAGIAFFGRMDEVPLEEWERLMQINLLAPMRLSTLFAGAMIARRQGHIVNISSLAGWVAPAGLTHYATSKFGLRGFSEGLYQEVKPYNVQVTAVYPFFSRTPILYQSPRYGTLAQDMEGFPPQMATDPARVIRSTLQGIRRNQLHVFPDAIAQVTQCLKRHTPNLLNWISEILTRRLKRDADTTQA